MPDVNNQEMKKKNAPNVNFNDVVRVYYKANGDGANEVQTFQGTVARIYKESGQPYSIIVHKSHNGVNIKKNFILNSPLVPKIEVIKRSRVVQKKPILLPKIKNHAKQESNKKKTAQASDIKGRIGGGKGIAQGRLASIKGLDDALGYTHVPGTLNIRLSRDPNLSIKKAPIQIAGHGLWPVTVSGVKGHIIRWSNDKRDTSVEVISDVNLRNKLHLKDKDKVLVKIL